MNRDKQIEEMAKVICLSYGKGVCLQCDDYEDCTVTSEAERLYNAGYRKASEILDEIEEQISHLSVTHFMVLPQTTRRNIFNIISKLKKKYTEEEK